jgi:hypothetical protein
MRAGTLEPTYSQPPQVAAVPLDAGKIRLRADDGERGVRQPHGSDTKVGCLQTYTSKPCEHDPQPDPPALFLDRPRVVRLCQEMEEIRGNPATRPQAAKADRPLVAEAIVDRPQRLVRTAVATMQGIEGFGWMVAAEAMCRGFYPAERRAVVGDGGNWIAPLGQMHFPGWEQVLDFLHLLVHLYAAAMVREQLERLGPSPTQAPHNDPRKTLSLVLPYVCDNGERMDYPRYRREGLPVTSTLVESLIKQFNKRVKGTEKFWVRPGAEAILQGRAAYLSEDGRDEAFYAHRPRGRAVGRNRLRLTA